MPGPIHTVNGSFSTEKKPMEPGDGKVPLLQPIKRDYTFFGRGDLDS